MNGSQFAGRMEGFGLELFVCGLKRSGNDNQEGRGFGPVTSAGIVVEQLWRIMYHVTGKQ